MPRAAKKPPQVDAHALADALSIGPHVPFASVAQVCHSIEQLTSRLSMQSRITDLIRAMRAKAPRSIAPTLMLLTNQIAPPYENVELGVGDALLCQAIAQLKQIDVARLKEEAKRQGDLVKAALSFAGRAAPASSALTVQDVFDTLRSVASMSGKGSQQGKIDRLASLMAQCSDDESLKLAIRIV
jgi:DNA ligase-1